MNLMLPYNLKETSLLFIETIFFILFFKYHSIYNTILFVKVEGRGKKGEKRQMNMNKGII